MRQGFLLGCVSGVALLALAVGQASAAIYPGGGSTFTGSAEGWTVVGKCPTIPAPLCVVSGAYDGTAGNPSGSLADKTEIAVGLLGLFTAEAVETSPTFTATESGAGALSLERQFEDAELASLTPTVNYTANLVDKSNGSKQQAFTDTVESATGFVPKQGPVALVAGHSYAIEIDATTKSSVLSVGLLGSATFHLDNVSVTGPGGGGNGGGGGGGGNGGVGGGAANGSGVSSARLESLIQSSSLVGPATLRGSRLSVKAKCPAKVGATCTITLQGMLNRHKPATTTRKAKVKKAKTKKFALTVKPAARSKVKAKSKLLFKETVKAGKAKATVWKALKVVRK
ncbi:MAG TPA: hypothetical protein VH299_01915 [Solirubrobacterales bacterium]|jgi:hypothetical protein|nr:hypothetical protein [Solirubrobacterales bacterium]